MSPKRLLAALHEALKEGAAEEDAGGDDPSLQYEPPNRGPIQLEHGKSDVSRIGVKGREWHGPTPDHDEIINASARNFNAFRNITFDEARGKLIQLREGIIQSEFPDSDRSRGLLRKQMIRYFLDKKPTTLDEFRNFFPLQLREKTDSRQMKYLDDIFEIIGEINSRV